MIDYTALPRIGAGLRAHIAGALDPLPGGDAPAISPEAPGRAEAGTVASLTLHRIAFDPGWHPRMRPGDPPGPPVLPPLLLHYLFVPLGPVDAGLRALGQALQLIVSRPVVTLDLGPAMTLALRCDMPSSTDSAPIGAGTGPFFGIVVTFAPPEQRRMAAPQVVDVVRAIDQIGR